MQVTKLKYYIPNEIDQSAIDAHQSAGVGVTRLETGDIDPVQFLFSDLALDDSGQTTKDPYGVGIENWPSEKASQYMKEIKVLVPEGYRDVLSLDTSRPARICIGSKADCKTAYKVKIRGMLTKMPGWWFTAYQSAQFFSQQLVSEAQYREILEDYFDTHDGTRENFEALIDSYTFTENVPKYKLFVRLSPDCTRDRREQIANGIRSFFRDERTILLDLSVAMQAIATSLTLFQIFVGVVGFIALTLAFFLLRVSTTQNVRDNVWEYGCLRAMGCTQKQGLRSFMYEQYSVIISSLFLGSLVGLVVASVVTAQFFLFLEFKFALDFPIELLYAMVVLALLTTFYAVYVPVQKVNKQKVATTLKGLAQD